MKEQPQTGTANPPMQMDAGHEKAATFSYPPHSSPMSCPRGNSPPQKAGKRYSHASSGTFTSRSSTDDKSAVKSPLSASVIAPKSRNQKGLASEPLARKTKEPRNKTKILEPAVKAVPELLAAKNISSNAKKKARAVSEFIPKRGTFLLPSLYSNMDQPIGLQIPEISSTEDLKTSGRKPGVENSLPNYSAKSDKVQSNVCIDRTSKHDARPQICNAQSVKPQRDYSVFWKYASPETKMYNERIRRERKPDNSLYLQIVEEDKMMSAILQSDYRNASEISPRKSKPVRKNARPSQTLSSEEPQPLAKKISPHLSTSLSPAPGRPSSKASKIPTSKNQPGVDMGLKSTSKSLEHLSQDFAKTSPKNSEYDKKIRTRKRDDRPTAVGQKLDDMALKSTSKSLEHLSQDFAKASPKNSEYDKKIRTRKRDDRPTAVGQKLDDMALKSTSKSLEHLSQDFAKNSPKNSEYDKKIRTRKRDDRPTAVGQKLDDMALKSSSKSLEHLSQDFTKTSPKNREHDKKIRTRKRDDRPTAVGHESITGDNITEIRVTSKTESSAKHSRPSSPKKTKRSALNVRNDLGKNEIIRDKKTQSEYCLSPSSQTIRQRNERTPRRSKASLTTVSQADVHVTKSFGNSSRTEMVFSRKNKQNSEKAVQPGRGPSKEHIILPVGEKGLSRKRKEFPSQSAKSDSPTSVAKKSGKLLKVFNRSNEFPGDALETDRKKRPHRTHSPGTTRSFSAGSGSRSNTETYKEQNITKKSKEKTSHQSPHKSQTNSLVSSQNNDMKSSTLRDKPNQENKRPSSSKSGVEKKSDSSIKSSHTYDRLPQNEGRLSDSFDPSFGDRHSPDNAVPKKKRLKKQFLRTSEGMPKTDLTDNNSDYSYTDQNSENRDMNHRKSTRKKSVRSRSHRNQDPDRNNSLQLKHAENGRESTSQSDASIDSEDKKEGDAGKEHSSPTISSSSSATSFKRVKRKRRRKKRKPPKMESSQPTPKPRFSGWDIGTVLQPAEMDHIPTELELTEQLLERAIKLGWDQDRRSCFLKGDICSPSVITSFGPAQPQTYLAEHQIHELFQYMTTKLVTEQPPDPLESLIEFTHGRAQHISAETDANQTPFSGTTPANVEKKQRVKEKEENKTEVSEEGTGTEVTESAHDENAEEK